MDDFAFQDGQTVVFIGDSITDCGRRAEFAPFGQGYVKFAIDLITARYPERNITYYNAGISGNTVLDLRERWQKDVLDQKPDWVTVKIGINDAHRTIQRTLDLTSSRYERLYREILQLTRDHTQSQIVLIDPFYIITESETNTEQGQILALLNEYLDIIEKLTDEFETLHVYTHAKFQEQLRHRRASHFCPEPVHPDPRGHMIIASALLDVLGW